MTERPTGGADGEGEDMASATKEATGASALEALHTETAASPDFFV